MTLLLPSVVKAAGAVSLLAEGPSPAAVEQLKAALADLAATLPNLESVPEDIPGAKAIAAARKDLFARSEADLLALVNLPADKLAARRAARGLYQLVLLSLRHPDTDLLKWELLLKNADVKAASAAWQETTGAVAKALWDVAPPVVFGKALGDVAAGKIPEPLARLADAAKKPLGQLLLGAGVVLGVGFLLYTRRR